MHGRGLLPANHDGHCKGASQGTAYTGRRPPCRRASPHMGAQSEGGFQGISYEKPMHGFSFQWNGLPY